MYKLILIRHGQSEWNLSNQFTGWTDVDLTPKGVEEAREAGKLLAANQVEVRYAFTSYLKRAIKTLDIVLEEMDLMWLPVEKTWRLNEKHYGFLQGMNKAEAVNVFGEKQVKLWRRSYDVAPDPLPDDDPRNPKNDERYKWIKDKSAHPKTESLADATRRIIPLWNGDIMEKLREYKQVLIVAHGNSLRGVVKFIKNMSNEEIVDLNIPTGIPFGYEFDDDFRLIKEIKFVEDEVLRQKAEEVANQTKQH